MVLKLFDSFETIKLREHLVCSWSTRNHASDVGSTLSRPLNVAKDLHSLLPYYRKIHNTHAIHQRPLATLVKTTTPPSHGSARPIPTLFKRNAELSRAGKKKRVRMQSILRLTKGCRKRHLPSADRVARAEHILTWPILGFPERWLLTTWILSSNSMVENGSL